MDTSTAIAHHNILPYIDKLAEVRAQIYTLGKQEEALKNLLKPLGPGTHSSDNYTLTIGENEREVLDQVAVREKLSAQFLRAHTTVTKFLTLKITKRHKPDETE